MVQIKATLNEITVKFTWNWCNFELTMFELIIHFKHEMRGIWQRKLQIKWNFELTVFELTIPDL